MKNTLLDSNVACPICKATESQPVGEHIRQEHGEQAFVQAILDAKRAGMSDAKIGERFGVTFRHNDGTQAVPRYNTRINRQ